jgi:hypothetical protein
MLRKTTCAVAGIALACAAGYSLSLIARSEALSDLDLRWIQASAKQDRLPVNPLSRDGGTVVSFDLPSQGRTIVMKSPAHPVIESAVRTPRSPSVRTIPVRPVREVPNGEEGKRERLPDGCEPAFSPVTTPAFAHIGVRCDS